MSIRLKSNKLWRNLDIVTKNRYYRPWKNPKKSKVFIMTFFISKPLFNVKIGLHKSTYLSDLNPTSYGDTKNRYYRPWKNPRKSKVFIMSFFISKPLFHVKIGSHKPTYLSDLNPTSYGDTKNRYYRPWKNPKKSKVFKLSFFIPKSLFHVKIDSRIRIHPTWIQQVMEKSWYCYEKPLL